MDYQQILVNCPPTGFIPDNLHGYWTEDNNYLCANCAGRILARGILLPKAEPVWLDAGTPYGQCAGCDNA